MPKVLNAIFSPDLSLSLVKALNPQAYLILVAHDCRDFQQILLEEFLLKCGAKFDRSSIFSGCSILFGFDRILDVTFADSMDVMRKIVEKGNIRKILQVTLIRKGNKIKAS